jgi:polysaccharide biosynthesis transport protein
MNVHKANDGLRGLLYNHASYMAAIEPLASSEDTVWLGEYLSVLRRRKWSILIVTLLALLSALLYGRQQTPIYESNARVNASVVLQTQSANQAPNMETEQAFVTSDDVTKCAYVMLQDTSFRANPSQLPDLNTLCSTDALSAIALVGPVRGIQQNVTINTAPPSTVMTITYASPSTHAAQVGAQAFANAYIHERTAQASAQLDALRAPLLSQQDDLSKKISSLNDKISKKQDAIAKAADNGDPTLALTLQLSDLMSQREAVQHQLDDISTSLRNLDPSKLSPPQLLLPAGLPQDPVSPDMVLLAAFGVLAGLALGIALAFLRERLDDSLRGRLDLEANLSAPVLAFIPRVPGWRNKHDARLVTREQPKSAVAEAYRTLRTSISFLAAQRGLKVLMITSPAAGEGKTTTAANLALVLADAGKRVVLVSADLRKPRIHRFFSIQNEVGLSSVLAGEIQPWEAILDPGVENLRVLLSGPVPSRPAELLQSDQMGEILAGLREVADYVIIDTAPMLVVADALALAPLVDGVLFVADSDHTSRSAVAHSREQLEQIGAVLIGSVLNNFDPAKARAYRHYGYYGPYRGYGRYGYYYGAGVENGELRKGEAPVMQLPQDRRNT